MKNNKVHYKKTGTKEWAEHNRRFCKGCSNDCIYCWARASAMQYNRIEKSSDWKNQIIINHMLDENPKKLNGRIMFPSTHDIVPEIINETITYLKGWLSVGNEILIVSKPNKECIQKLCELLIEYKDQITFRFTIGSYHDDVLKFWDRNAPLFQERFDSLKLAYGMGYKTSVSCEPYLDGDIVPLVRGLIPYVTDTIWVGKLNRIRNTVDVSDVPGGFDNEYIQKVIQFQTDEYIRDYVYPNLNHLPQVRWKESIKKVMGIKEDEKVG